MKPFKIYEHGSPTGSDSQALGNEVYTDHLLTLRGLNGSTS